MSKKRFSVPLASLPVPASWMQLKQEEQQKQKHKAGTSIFSLQDGASLSKKMSKPRITSVASRESVCDRVLVLFLLPSLSFLLLFFFFFEIGRCYAAEVRFKPGIRMLLFPGCWDYGCSPPCPTQDNISEVVAACPCIRMQKKKMLDDLRGGQLSREGRPSVAERYLTARDRNHSICRQKLIQPLPHQ